MRRIFSRRLLILTLAGMFAIAFSVQMVRTDSTIILEHKENFTVYRNSKEPLIGLNGTDPGYNLTQGDILYVSWRVTDNPLLLPPIVWLLTEEQRDHFSHVIGGPHISYGYILKKMGWEEHFCYSVPSNGIYCVVIHNINWGALAIEGPEIEVEIYDAILLPPQPYGPLAEFTATPKKVTAQEFVKFDASDSQPGFNGTHKIPIVEYRWSFGDGNKTTVSTPVVYHSFQSVGVYYVTLTVYAPGATPETDMATHKVTVVSIPVGGYIVPTKRCTTRSLGLYLTLITILAAIFAIVKCKTHKRMR